MYRRDRFTWLNFVMMAIFGYVLLALGPLMTFLSAELRYSGAQSGLHMSLYAVGAIIAGFAAPGMVRRFGRRRIFWGAAAGLMLAVAGLPLARSLVFSLAAFLALGLTASHLITVIQAALADHHDAKKGQALSEGNFIASISQAIPPLLIAALVGAGQDWRWTLYGVIIFTALTALAGFRLPFPEQAPAPGPSLAQAAPIRTGLPGSYWKAWVLLIFLVCSEWTINYWGLAYLSDRADMDPQGAALGFGAYTVAYIAGRLGGSLLMRRFKAGTLLPLVLFYILLAFLVFWLSTIPWLSVSAIALVGLGIANVYPLGLTMALDSAPGQMDLASGKTLWAVGGGLLVAPLLLGWLGDSLPLFVAFSLEPVFLAGAFIAFLIWKRSARD